MYKRLSFIEACRLRTYRHDQYSFRREKLIKMARHRSQHRVKTGMPIPATTTIDMFTIGQALARPMVLPGIPLVARKSKNDPSKISKIDIQQSGDSNYFSAYKQHSNALSASDPTATENLEDEIPIEFHAPKNSIATHRALYDQRNGKRRVYERVPYIETQKTGDRNRKIITINVVYERFSVKGGELLKEPVEQLGSFDPVPNRYGYKVCGLNVERIKYWLACGVQLTSGAAKILGLAGITPLSPETVFTAEKLKEREIAEVKASEYVRKNKLDQED